MLVYVKFNEKVKISKNNLLLSSSDITNYLLECRQSRIQNPVKHLRWSFLAKIFPKKPHLR